MRDRDKMPRGAIYTQSTPLTLACLPVPLLFVSPFFVVVFGQIAKRENEEQYNRAVNLSEALGSGNQVLMVTMINSVAEVFERIEWINLDFRCPLIKHFHSD
jgi:hypothetical protein